MNPNYDENEYVFKDDNESDIWFMMKALELHEMMEQEEMGETSHSRHPIHCEYDAVEERLMRDYFGDHPKYPEWKFRRRYCMSRKLFLEIVEGQMSLSVIMKFTSAIRQLAYDTTADSFGEYIQMGEHTARDCLNCFTMSVIDLFMPVYLRKLDFKDIQQLYDHNSTVQGFLGMLGSIDCMHWEWIKCPKS
ncbi:ALP1-like protein [Tanacetum coccineum]